ncbi:hypothetical protein [Cohnella sp. 56]|uniref:hypothetical protein n=1 Tax=Cohnella sp. 56 TaxID=3113722 RepID=UPI0030E87AFB
MAQDKLNNPSAIELDDRREDAEELRWLLSGIRRELDYYQAVYPDEPFELELAGVFARQLDALEERAGAMAADPAICTWDAYLTLKYEIRKLYKQLGGIVSGSDWQTPGKRLRRTTQATTDERGFAQEEQGTYERCYGSEAVKDYEHAAMTELYRMPAGLTDRSALFLTGSGMKALELGLVAYRVLGGARLPCYCQAGFYGEGALLAQTLLDDVQTIDAQAICRRVEANEPIGCLIVDPGVCWPVRPPVDLPRLFAALGRHRQREPLYVIVDRTLTSVANPLFERYAAQMPPHVVLVCVESGIKYLQYGFDLANVGYLAVCAAEMAREAYRARWIELLSILDAGADPLTVRQLPPPDRRTIVSRLGRINRNAYCMDEYLGRLASEGRIRDYCRSVDPSDAYRIEGRPWLGSVFYIRLPGELTEQAYQARIDACVRDAPPDLHLVSGGSFGFDTLRLNAVHGESPDENALRLSVGRAPRGQLAAAIKALDTLLLQP